MLFYQSSDENLHYLIYPSWGRFKDPWNELPIRLNDPISFRTHEKDLAYTDMNPRKLELIDGSEGGGIIVYEQLPLCDQQGNGLGLGRQWKGYLLFCIDQYQPSGLRGTPATVERSAKVAYLTRRETELLQRLGLEKKTKQYDFNGSFDHVESVGDNIYVALLCHHDKKVKPKIFDQFSELTKQFGLCLTFLDKTPKEIATEKSWWFRKGRTDFHWYRLETECNEVQRIFAYLIYCGLHQVRGNTALWGIQLTAQIEHQPQGRLDYHRTEAEDEECRRRRKKVIEDFKHQIETNEEIRKLLKRKFRKRKETFEDAVEDIMEEYGIKND